MKKLYLYYLIFLLTTIICGCQEQPNTEIIINKMETEQNLYKDAEEYTPYLAQEKWNEIVSGKDVTYVFDAEICIPDVNAYPIYEVLPSFFEFLQYPPLLPVSAEAALYGIQGRPFRRR